MLKLLHNKKIISTFSLLLVLLSILNLAACGGGPVADPHEGMVQVSDGMGGMMWVPVLDGVEASDLVGDEFEQSGNYIDYIGTSYKTMRGIDVSSHQGDIDWELVAEDGVEFAIIRVGYRGYTEGGIYEDEKFKYNIQSALDAGLKVGVYFFSQAVNVEEAQEEASFVLNAIQGYNVSMPVVFDWEEIGEEARTDGVDGQTLTDSCLAFCQMVDDAGFEPAVYFYRRLGYFEYELDRLTGMKFWVGALGDKPDFYYKHHIWQYSITGQVAGIEGDVDLDISFEKLNVSQVN